MSVLGEKPLDDYDREIPLDQSVRWEEASGQRFTEGEECEPGSRGSRDRLLCLRLVGRVVMGLRLWPFEVALLSLALLVPSGAGAACSAPVAGGGEMVVGCPSVGAEQSFVVPRGVTSVHVVAVGGHGGLGGYAGFAANPGGGGMGAIVSADLRVTPGVTLYVLVGGVGRTFPVGPGPGAGGFNGGGAGGAAGGTSAMYGSGVGGGGGGASDVRTCSVRDRTCDTLASRLLIGAGGGGGGGGNRSNDFSLGGRGGAAGTDAAGGDGGPPTLAPPTGGGKGASRTTGGSAGGEGAGGGMSGAGGHGAAAGPPTPDQPGAGGGGGGGLYGGGGGAAGSDALSAGAGGGGGSSFGPSGATFTSTNVFGGGPVPPSVTISYTPAPAVVVTRPRAGQVLRGFVGVAKRERRQLVITGRARDRSGVQGVVLSIERLPRSAARGSAKRCVWLHRSRGLVRARCDRPSPLIAKLRADGSWSYRLARRIRLRAGRYRISAVGKNNAGVFGNSAPRRSSVITFRLSQG